MHWFMPKVFQQWSTHCLIRKQKAIKPPFVICFKKIHSNRHVFLCSSSSRGSKWVKTLKRFLKMPGEVWVLISTHLPRTHKLCSYKLCQTLLWYIRSNDLTLQSNIVRCLLGSIPALSLRSFPASIPCFARAGRDEQHMELREDS